MHIPTLNKQTYQIKSNQITWRNAFLCKTFYRGLNIEFYKEYLLKVTMFYKLILSGKNISGKGPCFRGLLLVNCMLIVQNSNESTTDVFLVILFNFKIRLKSLPNLELSELPWYSVWSGSDIWWLGFWNCKKPPYSGWQF